MASLGGRGREVKGSASEDGGIFINDDDDVAEYCCVKVFG